MGIFAKLKLNEAKLTGGGVYFEPTLVERGTDSTAPVYKNGLYTVTVDCLKIIRTRANDDLFVCETLIMESNNPVRPVGSRCNWSVTLSNDAAPGNIKALLCALSGLDPNGGADAKAIADEDWDAVGETAVSDDNPFKGESFSLECWYQLKRNAKPTPGILDPSKDVGKKGAYFVKHVFRPVGRMQEAA